MRVKISKDYRITTEMSRLSVFLRSLFQHEKITFGYTVGQIKNKGDDMALSIQITDSQKVQVTLNPVTSAGKPAKVDGKPVWTVQSGDGTLVVALDGLSAFLISGLVLGDTAVLVEADADLGSGVAKISGQIILQVFGSKATNLGLVAGTPVDK